MLPEPEEGGPQHGVRASDADRARLVDALRTACADGRITLDEFAERVGEVYAARTLDDLARVTADLAALVPAPLPAGAAGAPAVGSDRRRATTAVRAILSGSHTGRGRWRAASRMKALAVMGGCTIDLRDAEIDGPEVSISATAVMGGVEIVVPEGIEVELTGLAVMGGKERRVRDVPPRPGTPVVRVKAFAFWGAVMVRSRPSREEERARREQRRGEHHVRVEQRQRSRAEQAARRLPPIPAMPPIPPRPGLPADPHDLVRSIVDSVFGGGGGSPRADDLPAAPDGTVTIMFSDIAGFTSITERLGDSRAQELLRSHNEIIRGQLAAHGGREVKSHGDSFMMAFAGAGRALRCAVGIQRGLAGWSADHPDQPVAVRVGLHTGDAIREADDLFGRTVIVASRIADTALAEEILVSSLVVQLAEGAGEFVFDEGREVELKGLSQPYVVHRVKWEAD